MNLSYLIWCPVRSEDFRSSSQCKAHSSHDDMYVYSLRVSCRDISWRSWPWLRQFRERASIFGVHSELCVGKQSHPPIIVIFSRTRNTYTIINMFLSKEKTLLEPSQLYTNNWPSINNITFCSESVCIFLGSNLTIRNESFVFTLKEKQSESISSCHFTERIISDNR